MGKTTVCNKYGYIDDDMYYPNRPTIKTIDIVLTNEPTEGCDMYFLPPDYKQAFNKLSKDKQKFFNEYKDLLKNQYNLVKEKYNPIIKEYITQKNIEEILKKKGKLRRGYITNSLVYKIDDDIENKKQELNKLKNEIEKYNNKIQTRRIVTKPIHICELNFSIRTTNSLIRANIDTLEKLVKYTLNNEILKTRSLGKKSYFEILTKLQDMKIIKYDSSIDNVNDVIHSIRLIRRPFVFVKIP